MPKLESLLPEKIQKHLKTNSLGKVVLVFRTIDSTNGFALKLIDPKHGTLVLAETQTRGRGRLGRKWHSADHKGIWLTLILKPSAGLVQPASLTMLMALSIVETLKRDYSLDCAIKWPNDIYLNHKKVCGILTEAKTTSNRVEFYALGVGLNVNQTNRNFPAELRRLASSLRIETGRKLSRPTLIQKILLRFEEHFKEFQGQGFARFLPQWEGMSETIGKQVKIATGRRTLEGLAVGLDTDGSLLVRLDSGVVHKVHAGDITHLTLKT